MDMSGLVEYGIDDWKDMPRPESTSVDTTTSQ